MARNISRVVARLGIFFHSSQFESGQTVWSFRDLHFWCSYSALALPWFRDNQGRCISVNLDFFCTFCAVVYGNFQFVTIIVLFLHGASFVIKRFSMSCASNHGSLCFFASILCKQSVPELHLRAFIAPYLFFKN